MKEFLVNRDNKWTLQLLDSDTKESSFCVAVPSGANICINGYFYKDENTALIGSGWMDCHKTGVKTVSAMINTGGEIIWQRSETESINDQFAEIEQVRQETVKVTIDELKHRENKHYFIDVSDVDEVDFYEIAKRYNVTDPAIQHILKKCLAIGNRGHKDLETDLKDILKTAKRALVINGFNYD